MTGSDSRLPEQEFARLQALQTPFTTYIEQEGAPWIELNGN